MSSSNETVTPAESGDEQKKGKGKKVEDMVFRFFGFPIRVAAKGTRIILINLLIALSPILALGMGILILVFLVPSLTKLAMQEEQIRQLQRDVDKKSAELIGVHKETEEGESAWRGIETNLRTQLATVHSELDQVAVDRNNLRSAMEDAREAVRQHGGILGDDATLAEGVDSAAERLNQEIENWHTLSDTSRDGMHAAQRREIKARTQLLKSSADAWRMYMGVVRLDIREFRSEDPAQSPAARRDAYVIAINAMLGVIKDQLTADLALENASERLWASTEESSNRLCIDAVLATLSGVRQDSFPFSNGIDREVEGLINRLKR